MPITYDILSSLHKMFGCKTDQPIAFKIVMNAKKLEETPIRDHMIHMIKLFNKKKILGTDIDGETHVKIVLETLLYFFKSFKLNYSMNKLMMSLIELGTKRGIHMVAKGSLGFSSQEKKKTLQRLPSKRESSRARGRRRARDEVSVFFMERKAIGK